MASRLVAVTFGAREPTAAAAFWGRLLDRDVMAEPGGGSLLPGDATQVGLRFVPSTSGDPGSRPLHLHVTSTDRDDQHRTIETALRLGGRHLDVGQLPGEDHVVLADPEGRPFCVIGPDNRFLAGCGRLGEVACDGTRDVGRFWSGALGWPLVWDEAGETAVQSPSGGTKIAWGGPPVAPKSGSNEQRFELTTNDLPSEVTRLVALGATRLATREGGVELADPDGNEITVTGASPGPTGTRQDGRNHDRPASR